MTLYVIDSTRGGGQTGVHSHLPAVVKASPADVLRWQGWEDCPTCDGSGACKAASHTWFGGEPTEQLPCPDCAHGMVPPVGMVEAAAKGAFDAEYQHTEIWHQEPEAHRDRYRLLTRAALVAVARWKGEK